MKFVSATQLMSNKNVRHIYFVQRVNDIEKLLRSIEFSVMDDGVTIIGSIGKSNHKVVFTDDDKLIFINNKEKTEDFKIFNSLDGFIVYYLATFW